LIFCGFVKKRNAKEIGILAYYTKPAKFSCFAGDFLQKSCRTIFTCDSPFLCSYYRAPFSSRMAPFKKNPEVKNFYYKIFCNRVFVTPAIIFGNAG